jgi:hypothetical protein
MIGGARGGAGHEGAQHMTILQLHVSKQKRRNKEPFRFTVRWLIVLGIGGGTMLEQFIQFIQYLGQYLWYSRGTLLGES